MHKFYILVLAKYELQLQYDLHEDHIGAVAHIWPKLKCKIYATPFTATLLVEKFKEKKIDIVKHLKIVALNSKIKLGHFEIDFVTLTHSILEPNGLCIKTPLGTILHAIWSLMEF